MNDPTIYLTLLDHMLQCISILLRYSLRKNVNSQSCSMAHLVLAPVLKAGGSGFESHCGQELLNHRKQSMGYTAPICLKFNFFVFKLCSN